MVLSSFVMKRFQNPMPPILEIFAAYTERAGDLPAPEIPFTCLRHWIHYVKM